MSDEYKVTSDEVVVVKFIEVASWHKRAWDFGRENIIIISPQKIHFFSLCVVHKLLFLTLFGITVFQRQQQRDDCSRSRKRYLHNVESL